MVTEICKCGNAMSELMSDIQQLEKNINGFRFENIGNMDIQKVRTSIYQNYNLIHKAKEYCSLDTKDEEDISDKNFLEAAFLVFSPDLSEFSTHQGTMSTNLNKIKIGIQRKIKDCSQ